MCCVDDHVPTVKMRALGGRSLVLKAWVRTWYELSRRKKREAGD